MANLIDYTTSNIYLNNVCFENKNIDNEKIPLPIENVKFGILNFKAVKMSETRKELDFIFVIDCSGSMSDICSDGKSKMQHIIHTLKNMIMFLYEHVAINTNITINAFDIKIYKIIERTKITHENLDEIITKIDRIRPLSSTNIEYALRKTAEYIRELKTNFPLNVINHIFMTDGKATHGSNEITLLKSLIVGYVLNAFIGFGIEHDADLLNGIGSVGKSSYHFIDKLENAGFIYGEILHSIIYKILTDCKIHLTNGLIYDFETNTWVSNLKIGDIISEASKTYNIVSTNPDEFSANIQGNLDNLVVLYPSIKINNADLENHIFRQRTLQLMYEVNDFYNRKKIELNPTWKMPGILIEKMANNFKTEGNSLKRKLSSFMDEMKNFMIKNNLSDDKFMKNLCDDIYICFQTFDTEYGTMFCRARQTSQGTQRQYTVSNTLNIEKDSKLNPRINFHRINFHRHSRQNITCVQRQTNVIDVDQEDLNNNDIIILNHEVSGFDETPYLTPQATQVMRYVSSNNEDGFENHTQNI